MIDPIETEELQPAKKFSRRKLLRRGAAGLLATGLGSLAYAWRVEPHWIEIVRRPLPIAKLPARLIGKRIVQLSDLHIGPIVDRNFITAAIGGVEKFEPDMIVVTGDLMTCNGGEQIDQALGVMESLPQAPLGRLAVLGNHDYGYGWRQLDSADNFARQLERLDIRVLRNEVADASGLQIMGVDDLYTSRFAPGTALLKFDRSRPGIALCHNPDGADQPAMQHFPGWILSGHTHGGQCKPPLFGPPMVPVNNPRYIAGEYELSNGRRLYINRGVGYTHRVRFNCRPEITVFTLAQANDAAPPSV